MAGHAVRLVALLATATLASARPLAVQWDGPEGAAVPSAVAGALGLDVAFGVDATQAACLAQAGFQWAVVRCYRSVGSVDTRCAPSVQALRQGGVKEVDVYFFPDAKQTAPAPAQVADFLAYAKNNTLDVSRVWLDVEILSWPADPALTDGGYEVGVYTSHHSWASIFGDGDYTIEGVSGVLPLWYPHYDNRTTFDDFAPFGGWDAPVAKQFDDGPAVCGVSLDHNWRP